MMNLIRIVGSEAVEERGDRRAETRLAVKDVGETGEGKNLDSRSTRELFCLD